MSDSNAWRRLARGVPAVLILGAGALHRDRRISARRNAPAAVHRLVNSATHLARFGVGLLLGLVPALLVVPELARAQSGAAGPDSVAPAGAEVPHEAASRPQVPDWMNRLSFEGVSFLRYSYDVAGPTSDQNEFDIDRVYFTLRARLWEKGTLRYTIEGTELREDGTNQFDLATKYFYLQVDGVLGEGSYLRAGQLDLPWVPYEERVWGYRFQGKVLPDRAGYLTSTDLGVAAGGELPRGYGSWEAALVNGEGWKRGEAGKHKDVHARLTLNPLAGLGGAAARFFVTGFAALGTYDGLAADVPTEKRRLIAQVGYKDRDRGTLAAEALWTRDPADALAARYPRLAERAGRVADGRGFSVFGTLGLGRGWEAIARVDRWDPDEALDDEGYALWIGGVAYRPVERLRLLLNYEAVGWDDAAGRADERRWMLQAEVRF